MSFYIIFSAPVLLKRGSDRVVGAWQPAKVNPQHLARNREQSFAFCAHERERNDQIYGILVSDNKALLLQKISSALFS